MSTGRCDGPVFLCPSTSAAALSPRFFEMKAVVIEELPFSTSDGVFCQRKGESNHLSRVDIVHSVTFSPLIPGSV